MVFSDLKDSRPEASLLQARVKQPENSPISANKRRKVVTQPHQAGVPYTNIQELPDFVLLDIFELLDLPDWCSLLTVSKYFMRITKIHCVGDSKLLWKMRDFGIARNDYHPWCQ